MTFHLHAMCLLKDKLTVVRKNIHTGPCNEETLLWMKALAWCMSSNRSNRRDEVWIAATMSFFHGDKKSIYQPFCTQCIFNTVTLAG